jgi:hypothetical protein
MRVAFVISSLGGGGAERVLSALANAWASDHTNITLITLGNRKSDAYALDPAIERLDLDLVRPSSGALSAIFRNVERVRRLRAALVASRPDVVISFMTTTNLLTLLATRGLGRPDNHLAACGACCSGRCTAALQPSWRRPGVGLKISKDDWAGRWLSSTIRCPNWAGITAVHWPLPLKHSCLGKRAGAG